MAEQSGAAGSTNKPAAEAASPSSAQTPATSGTANEPAVEAAGAAQGMGWLLQPGASSLGLYIEVTADAAELTPEIIRGIEQLMTNAHGASEAIVHPTMMKNCGQLETCGTFKGTCSSLSSCGSYH